MSNLNSGWKIASGSMPRLNFHSTAQILDRLRFAQFFSSTPEGTKKTTGVFGRAKQMCSLHDRRQFIRGNQATSREPFPADNHHFLRRDAIQHRRELVAKLGVGGLHLYFASDRTVQ